MKCVFAFAVLIFMSELAPANDGPAAKTPPTVGESMPTHIVEFVAGIRCSGNGCLAVMLHNARARGVEIWANEESSVAWRLAKEIDPLISESEAKGFLVLFDSVGAEEIRRSAKQHGLNRFQLATPHRSTQRLWGKGPKETVLVFQMHGRTINRVWRLKEADLRQDSLDEAVAELKFFLRQESGAER